MVTMFVQLISESLISLGNADTDHSVRKTMCQNILVQGRTGQIENLENRFMVSCDAHVIHVCGSKLDRGVTYEHAPRLPLRVLHKRFNEQTSY